MAHPILSTLPLLIFAIGANGYFFPSNFHFSSGSDWLNDDDDHGSDFGTHNHGSDLSSHNHGSDIGNDDHGFRYDHSYGNSFGFQHDSFHSRPRYPFVSSQLPPVTPPDHHPPFYHVVRYQPNQGLPLIIRLPNQQTVILPVRAVYSLPIFLENIIRKIQDYYSVYNVIDTLYLHRHNDTVTVKTATETPGGATTTATPGNGTSAGNGNGNSTSTTASTETSATTVATTEGSTEPTTTEGGSTTPPEPTTAAPAE